MIHKYKLNNLNIVLDVNSGSVFCVDELVYNILDDYEKEIDFYKKYSDFSSADVEEALEEIKYLKDNRVLFSELDYSKLMPKVDNRAPVIKALCIHIAHDCNLKCKYCFAEEGEYHGSRSFMTFEVGKKAIDFLVENSSNRINLEIDFFGGEPLMNFDVVKSLVEYGRSIEKDKNKKFRFTLTTNGVLLNDEIIEYANKHMHNVVLSLDGRKEINDNMRITLNNKSSYDVIVPKFQHLANSRNQNNYYVRGTFTKNNLDFSKDVLHMADLGFKQISVEPVVAPQDADYAISKEDLSKIFTEYENLAFEMLKRKEENKEFNFFHFMIDLTGGPCAIKRMVGCGAGSEYLAVTPEGNLFPCHQFVGDDEFKIGTVEDGIVNFTKRKDFENCNVYTKKECDNCWAKFYCSGGCAANAYANHKDILATYEVGCEMQKKRIECAIMLKCYEEGLA
ncbi:MAG: thioether cross-link-forming SCIFF peptide maturase [Lachnospirales bacterium]